MKVKMMILFGFFVLIGSVPDSLAFQNACRVSIEHDGIYRATFEGISPRILRFQSSGFKITKWGVDQRLCNENSVVPRLRDFEFYPSFQQARDERYNFLLLNVRNELSRGNRFIGGLDDNHYDEFRRIIIEARQSDFQRAVWSGIVDMAFKILEQFPAVRALSIPRQLLMNASREFIHAGLEGGPERLEQAAIDQAVWLARQTGREAVSDELLKAFEAAIHGGFKSLEGALKEIGRPFAIQRLNGHLIADECTWDFRSEWNPLSGRYRMSFMKECGKPEELRAISNAEAEFAPPRAKPGEQNIEITLRAFNHLGGQSFIESIDEIDGLEKIMDEGENYVTANIPGAEPKVTFNVATPRKDDLYDLRFELTDSYNQTLLYQDVYEIVNVAPDSIELQPNSTEAAPGEMMELNMNLTVRDENADKHNEDELHTSRINFSEQPEGLTTEPRFDTFEDDEKERISHDEKTGIYEFGLSRNGRVAIPHSHGEFFNNLIVEDRNGETAQTDVSYKVLNVAPTITDIEVHPRRNLDSGNVIEISILARIEDHNSRDDIRSVKIDATNAGAERIFTLSDGLELIKEDKDGIEVRTSAFTHTSEPGYHRFTIEAGDGPDRLGNCNIAGTDRMPGQDGICNHTTATDSIHVGNKPPVITTHGLLYETHTIAGQDIGDLIIRTGDEGGWDVEGPGGGLCPGQEFDVQVRAFDPENHPFNVTATLNGRQTRLDRLDDGRPEPEEMHERQVQTYTFKGSLYAPDKPGEYTVSFIAQETVHDEQEGEVKTLPVTVIPCDEEEDPQTAPDPEDEPVTDPDPEPEIFTEETVSFRDRYFSDLNFKAGAKIDYATANRIENAVCDQLGLTSCNVPSGTPVFVAFLELGLFGADISNMTIPIDAGISYSRRSVDFTQAFQYGIAAPFPYDIDGSVNISTLEFYGRASWPDISMPFGVLSPHIRLGVNRVWNFGQFDILLPEMPPDEELYWTRRHSGTQFVGGIGVDMLFAGTPWGIRINADYIGGGSEDADANTRAGIGFSIRHTF